jgi:porin
MRIACVVPLFVVSCAVYAQDDIVDKPSDWMVEAVYTADTWRVDSHRGDDVRYLDNLDLTMRVDAEQMFGIRGVELFAYALYNNGHALNEGGANTVQGISNIEAVDALRLYEAWAEWELVRDASLRAGLYDVNSEFDSIDAAGTFINPSHGIGPDFAQSGVNGPSIFPSTSVAIRGQVEAGRWAVRAAVLDAIPGDPDRPDNTTIRWSAEEGLLYVAEVNYATRGGARTGVGYWQYSESFDDLVRTNEDGEALAERSYGAYAFAETPALALSDGFGELTAFTRTGWADADVNPVSRYVGAGVVWSGFIAEREDQFGVSIAQATMGAPWRRAMANEGQLSRSAETILELTVRFALGDFVTLQPDVQYVRHPGALADQDAQWHFGLRVEIGWSYAP